MKHYINFLFVNLCFATNISMIINTHVSNVFVISTIAKTHFNKWLTNTCSRHLVNHINIFSFSQCDKIVNERSCIKLKISNINVIRSLISLLIKNQNHDGCFVAWKFSLHDMHPGVALRLQHREHPQASVQMKATCWYELILT